MVVWLRILDQIHGKYHSRKCEGWWLNGPNWNCSWLQFITRQANARFLKNDSCAKHFISCSSVLFLLCVNLRLLKNRTTVSKYFRLIKTYLHALQRKMRQTSCKLFMMEGAIKAFHNGVVDIPHVLSSIPHFSFHFFHQFGSWWGLNICHKPEQPIVSADIGLTRDLGIWGGYEFFTVIDGLWWNSCWL